MKKSINITINNFVFQIEEDAYDILDKYLISIKNYYGKEKEGAEILFDIEASIAEKFSEKINHKKQVINLRDVEKVIRVMGQVEEFEQNENVEKNTKNSKDGKKEEQILVKKLYRDEDDQIIAGVCSGVASYFGIDPIFIRLLFVALFFMNGAGILIYIILWAVMPLAKTSSQKLEMRGTPINLKKIEQVVKEKSQMIKEEGRHSLNRLAKSKGIIYKIFNFPFRVLENIFSFLKKIIGGIWPFTSICLGVIFVLSSFFMILGLSIFLGILIFYVDSPYIVSDFPLSQLTDSPLYFITGISVYFVILIPIFFILMLGFTMLRRKNSFSTAISGILISLWIVAIAGAVVTGGEFALKVNSELQKDKNIRKVSRTYDYQDFQKLYIGGNFNVKVKQGDEFSVVAGGKEDDLDRISFNIEDGQLQIVEKLEKEVGKICIFCFNRESELEIIMPELNSYVGFRDTDSKIDGFTNDIYISLGETGKTSMTLGGQSIDCKLSGINSRLELTGTSTALNCELDGNANLYTDDFEVQNVKIKQGIFSHVFLDGKTDEMEIGLSGSARVSAFDFFTKNVIIKTEDHSRAEIRVLEKLKALATDYSKIYYRGNPKDVSKKINNSAKIEKEEDIDWE
ncbi:hypothetical protein A2331_01300 [Candidatus Falkowbacteria bacterium RIFOXYB2_FULL_34_18]|uniref:Phage shock protein PspC N-terminal domain-containing protein n=1 Tax=Candidatus Falkowbacteria bacterium RIFOXYD2_FULL_34_120 TaxID=1798007 RepID=A0A1F5TPU8_9BACT|nr:MAG: hypothetical protein A2331_01300 [Candidatus Falkowbacteria bacterium RIFOXYB2_FULL_34_18]OGF29254.1 MAG: hypothetical protein A2500_05180 [Candidatus Falkowbacteria bacterium RIFOXYC12_FULL_34_55]OGF36370.1 MAG: hypothetical protein A2466_00840 [Candidatus Falkowbacteria bacterium RIFOXYC2_FULL_34_220]OGF38849.1 MAG: hypothetical protein A2515_05600 [Candidatus Falkowbacteria bacterium RIFOXYD12_FULL_34_57]OGF40868.1 MAG: hypothetical protein A2531_03825 [Candidatus Falkowbacteria bact